MKRAAHFELEGLEDLSVFDVKKSAPRRWAKRRLSVRGSDAGANLELKVGPSAFRFL